MRVYLITVGGKMPTWVTVAFQDYAKRLPRELNPRLVELPLAGRLKNARIEQVRQAEAHAIRQALPRDAHLVALDVKGTAWSTEDLATQLESWRMDGRDVAFIVGGPDGLSAELLDQATDRWSLSNLTLPHPLVRVVWIEQLYRAWTILQNHPYHK